MLVVFVPVALVQRTFAKLEGVAPVSVRFAKVAVVAKKLVVVALVKSALVAKTFEDVAFVDVTFNAVNPPPIFNVFVASLQFKAAES